MPDQILPTKEDIQQQMLTTGRTFSQAQVIKAIRASSIGHLECVPLDAEYFCFDRNTVMSMVLVDKTNTQPYLETKRDCDKYARHLWANLSWDYVTKDESMNSICMTVDYSGGHSYCAAVIHEPGSDELSVIVIEPQTDQIVRGGQNMYVGKDGYILF